MQKQEPYAGGVNFILHFKREVIDQITSILIGQMRNKVVTQTYTTIHFDIFIETFYHAT